MGARFELSRGLAIGLGILTLTAGASTASTPSQDGAASKAPSKPSEPAKLGTDQLDSRCQPVTVTRTVSVPRIIFRSGATQGVKTSTVTSTVLKCRAD